MKILVKGQEVKIQVKNRSIINCLLYKQKIEYFIA